MTEPGQASMDVIMPGFWGKIRILKEAMNFSYNYSRLMVFLGLDILSSWS